MERFNPLREMQLIWTPQIERIYIKEVLGGILVVVKS